MNKHLSILVGADNRYPIVNYTLKRCVKYFDTVNIVYNCPEEYIDNYDFNNYDNINVVRIKQFFGDLEPCRRAMFKMIPKNEWFLWLDSDETPSRGILDNMDGFINELTISKIGVGRFPYVEHEYNNEKENGCYRNNPYDMSILPKNAQEFAIKNWFCGPRLIQNCGLYITSNFGGHETMCYRDFNRNNGLYFPHHIVHHKSIRSIYQSQLYHLFTIPWQHENYTSWGAIKDSKEFLQLREFQKKWKIYNSNQMSLQIHNKNEQFIVEFETLLKSYENSTINCFKWLSDLVNKLGSLHIDTKFHECRDKECCNYEL